MKHFLIPSLLASLALAACSKDNDGPANGGSGSASTAPSPELSCDHVLTDAKIAKFNAEQSAYRVRPMTGYERCEVSQTRNGEPRVGQTVTGAPGALIVPRVRAFGTTVADSGLITVRVEVLPVSDADRASVAASLGLSAERVDVDAGLPGFARLNRGYLYAVKEQNTYHQGDRLIFEFSLTSSDRDENPGLRQALLDYVANRGNLELLWRPETGVMFRQSLPAGGGWENRGAGEVLRATIFDRDGNPDRSVYARAAQLAQDWRLNPQDLYRDAHEIFLYANHEWQSPHFEASDLSYARDMWVFLVCILDLRPDHVRAPLRATMDRLRPVVPALDRAFQIALDYHDKNAWTKPQFDLLLLLGDGLGQSYREYGWDMAKAIAEHKRYDGAESLHLATFASPLAYRLIIPRTPAAHSLATLLGKMTAGLTDQNLDLYLRFFDDLRKNSLSVADAETAADRSVLSGRVTKENYSRVSELIRFLTNDFSVSASDAVDALSQLPNFEHDTLELLLDTVHFLSNQMSFGDKEALAKSASYLARPTYNRATFQAFRDYVTWLSSSMNLSNRDAVTRAETALANGSIGQVRGMQRFAQWLSDHMNLPSRDAIARAERILARTKGDEAAIQLIQEALTWLTNNFSQGYLDSVNRVESWLNTGNELTRERFATLQTLANWLSQSMNFGYSDAVKKGEALVIAQGLSAERVALLVDCGNWISGEVSLGYRDSALRAESYVVKYQMVRAQFPALQSEFRAFVNAGKGNRDALKLAAQKVLHAAE